jgi:beta-mannosidase
MFHLRSMSRIGLLVLFILVCSYIIFADVSATEISKFDKKFAFAQVRDGSSVTAEIDLNGDWQFKATDEDKWMRAIVPSTVWTDLLRVGRIEDPFYRDNEFKVQWIEKKEWEYQRTFQITADFLKHDKIILDCRGLDTIAEIYLNDQLVSKTQNMFIEYEFDVKSLLRIGENQIHIIFRSILDWNKKQNASEPRVIWDNEKGNSFFARREGSDFGWDWGVRLLTCGIWKSIRLAAYDIGRITDLAVRQDLSDPKKAVLDITAQCERFKDKKLNIEFEVVLKDNVIAETNASVTGDKVNKKISIKNPKLWWPNGWGGQPLYTVRTALLDGKTVVHSKEIKIGLRTIEIYRERDTRGETFGIKINGYLIFCKGVNWVPADALPDRLTEDHYKHLLRSCVEANMNMIRVWGGGLYESDIFYEYCDEHGIMIWHDFMFAVGPYIANESYLENVRQEIASVVRRLRHHPSIALWCGNNEQESNMPAWTKDYKTVTWEDYDKVFHETIPQTAALYDPDHPYWPSSPHHPLDRKKQKPDWESASGDAHLWDVWHGGEPFIWYARHPGFRFISEYGFQSPPVMKTIRSFTTPEDWVLNSYVLDHHNKAGKKSRGNQDIGNIRIANYMTGNFAIPNSFENWIYVAQVMHGEGMKVGTEAYRRNFPDVTGALYWQLNDNWPTFSGSSLDYYGRWKALHYMACHFLNPVLVSGFVEGTTIKIWGVNDQLLQTTATLKWILARFDGTEVKRSEQPVVLPANCSTLLAELDFEKEAGENPEYITYRKDCYENRGQFYLSYSLVQAGRELCSNVSFFALQKYLALEDPELEYEIKKDGDQLVVKVSAQRFAAYVELGLKESYARFSDNYFHLLPGEVKMIKLIESEVPVTEIENQFYIKSLVDSY